jgi:hypothetical protein
MSRPIYAIPVCAVYLAGHFVWGKPMRWDVGERTHKDGRVEEVLIPSAVFKDGNWTFIDNPTQGGSFLKKDEEKVDEMEFAITPDRVMVFPSQDDMLLFYKYNGKTLKNLFLEDKILEEYPEELFVSALVRGKSPSIPEDMVGVIVAQGKELIQGGVPKSKARYFLIPEVEFKEYYVNRKYMSPFHLFFKIDIAKHKEVKKFKKPKKEKVVEQKVDKEVDEGVEE